VDDKKMMQALGQDVTFRTALLTGILLLFMITGGAVLMGRSVAQRAARNAAPQTPETINQNIVDENPQDVESVIRLGYVHLQQQNYQKALQMYEAAYQMDPQSPLAQYHLALGYLAIEHYPQAIELLVPLAEKGLFNTDAHFTLGLAYYGAGDYEQSAESFRKTLALNPAAADAYYYLGLNYMQLGEREQAIRCLKKSLAMVPDFYEAMAALDRLYHQTPADNPASGD
jgi:tetratricopeptide (TPR) repeat protein